ncbi:MULTISPECIES: type II toxin-antitoxin system RelE/ParE family toxin [unclassified Arcicella]|uniref:type II toxin-antitoxin system RelE/ParE family toxin n=1 Tax=unclassified Arcicella TaxID=2644986 RepID=UPI002857AB13|nr:MULTISPECIES: type II toxin-antitoxin system RelE/ParE family toxin [unclassified Arcicella]MDR6563077.1 hypothetical protein [Arcicella sp. BE51]MDR6811772.1 mRNA-degrading endonuclease RelE of RelBE toxin-antitoxin system [Arcicella sp. BE140]MDR6823297.1 mRNA-degrading endonuclease RelE of RelBE toxin-antitoxin system [Arcicella sp. BE139]
MKVVILPSFKKAFKPLFKKYKSIDMDFEKLLDSLEENAFQGVSIGKDCHKVRMAITVKGKGKSGGARVITCVKIVNETIYLLTIYDKSEQENIHEKELDQLLTQVGL